MSDSKPTPTPRDGSIVSAIATLFGFLLALFSLFSVINTVFDLNITVKGTPLPHHWDATIGLIGVTVVFWAIWAFMTYVGPVRRFGQNHPWLTALFVVLFLVGVIVGITIWDNGNRSARNEASKAELAADSLDRLADNKTYFEGKPIPYRLVVLNPEATPVELWVDSQSVGTIAALSGTELQLPWEPVRVSIRQDGKELAAEKIKPDASQAQNAALLHVYNPLEKLHVWVFDYEHGYEGGKRIDNKEFEPKYVDSYYHDKLFEITKAGPFYILPNQKAPETTKYHPYRLVVLPDRMENGSENRPFAAWMMRHTDQEPEGSPVQSADELYKVWKAGE